MRQPLEVPTRKGTGARHVGLRGVQQREVLTQGVNALERDALRHGNAIERERTGVAEDPRVSVYTARDEHCVCGSVVEHARRILGRKHIAGADHRYVHARGDLVDGGPIGLASVELIGGAPVNRHRRGARLLHARCKLGGRVLPRRETAADLDGDGHARLAHARLHQRRGKLGLLHERGSLALGDDLARRARHVDVDETELLPHSLLHGVDGEGELLRLGAEQLHADLRLLGLWLHEHPRFGAFVRKTRNAHHLGVRHLGSATAAHNTVRRVRDPRHGRHQKRLTPELFT